MFSPERKTAAQLLLLDIIEVFVKGAHLLIQFPQIKTSEGILVALLHLDKPS
jgi:hypothetical protein